MKDYFQLNDNERKKNEENFLQEPEAFYEKAEIDQLKAALKRTYKERFLTMTRLMKLNIMFSKAKITHKEFPTSK